MASCCSSVIGFLCGGRPKDNHYEPVLGDEQRLAVADLLGCLENRSQTDFFSGPPLAALKKLIYSDNLDLQRSASLTFAEVTDKDVRAVSYETLEPLLFLLRNSDSEVQRAAGAALGNLAVNSTNKIRIVELGGLGPLIKQMSSINVEVQCNAVGCITNLATHEDNKTKIARSGALGPLTALARSSDMRVQRNATGALLNMTHSDENRQQLVAAGAIPVFVSLLRSSDKDLQYYCTTAISNIAVDEKNRTRLAATEPRLVKSLIELMNSSSENIQCQAALALRNLASDEQYQLEIVKEGGLTTLVKLLKSGNEARVLSAVACLRNTSIHPANETPIIEAGILNPLVDLLSEKSHEEVQCHTISTLRNLAASSDSNKALVMDSGAIEKCTQLILSAPVSVQSEMTAAIAVLALSEKLKPRLLTEDVFRVLIPLTKSESADVQGNSAAALGNLSTKISCYDMFHKFWDEPDGGIGGYLTRYLASEDSTFQHIAVWTLIQLEAGGDKKILEKIHESAQLKAMAEELAQRKHF